MLPRAPMPAAGAWNLHHLKETDPEQTGHLFLSNTRFQVSTCQGHGLSLTHIPTLWRAWGPKDWSLHGAFYPHSLQMVTLSQQSPPELQNPGSFLGSVRYYTALGMEWDLYLTEVIEKRGP